MLYTLKSAVNPEVLQENMETIHQFLRASYEQAKQHLHDGVTFFKEEFSTLKERTVRNFNRMQLPLNNFLKDNSRIITELKHERKKETEERVLLEGRMVPLKEVLDKPGEENY